MRKTTTRKELYYPYFDQFTPYLRNLMRERLDKPDDLPFDSGVGLSDAFIWRKTSEGDNFWSNINAQLARGVDPKKIDTPVRRRFFEFYDQLPEDIAQRAKIHWDNQYKGRLDYVPNSVKDALSYGFVWAYTPEGEDYWGDVYDGNYNYPTHKTGDSDDGETHPEKIVFDGSDRIFVGGEWYVKEKPVGLEDVFGTKSLYYHVGGIELEGSIIYDDDSFDDEALHKDSCELVIRRVGTDRKEDYWDNPHFLRGLAQGVNYSEIENEFSTEECRGIVDFCKYLVKRGWL